MRQKSQATLEFTLIFVIIVMLLFGLLSLWKWSVNNIVYRQKAYNSSRTQAGSSTPGQPEKPYSPNAITNNQVDWLK